MDLFGRALQDYHAGTRGASLTIRRDDGYADTHDPGLYFTEAPFAHEIDLLSQVHGPALDVGCGAGRTLLWLKTQGIVATGIDLSPGAVAVARARGCPDVRCGNILTDGMDLFPTNHFQSITLFGNNLGIGGTREGTQELLTTLATLIKTGGRLFVTGLNIAQTDSPEHLAYHAKNRAKDRPIGEIRMQIAYKARRDDWTHWFHPEPHELQGLTDQTGWQVETLKQPNGPFFQAILLKG